MLLHDLASLLPSLIMLQQPEAALFDALYSISFTLSPVFVYVVYSAMQDIAGRQSVLFARLGKMKPLITFLAIVLAILWIVVASVTTFSPRLFTDEFDSPSLGIRTSAQFVGTLWFCFPDALQRYIRPKFLALAYICIIGRLLVARFRNIQERYRVQVLWNRTSLPIARPLIWVRKISLALSAAWCVISPIQHMSNGVLMNGIVL